MAGEIELYTPKFYAVCGLGGLSACGLTHTLMTPVDLVKCRLQTGAKYTGTINGLSTIAKTEGLKGLSRGWAPTLIGYSAQGVCKFGFYEFFKREFYLAAGSNGDKYQTLLYAAASASAEVVADIALCPWEAVKVRVQTSEGWAKGVADGLPKFIKEEGFGGLYKGLVPLWSRQVPYTIMKFTAFEKVVTAIYAQLSKPKEQYNKLEQLGVSFLAGYIAGVFCAIVSHPADVVVSKLNKSAGGSFVSVAKELGFAGMWTGLVPRIFMIGTLTALQWLIYDTFKVYTGLPTTGKTK